MSTGTEQRRPALDGLRALAVLAVIGYHFGYRWCRGGFLGVDVFFVLSGYLITQLLEREFRNTSRLHLGQFWARRVRRLMPAIIVLLLAVAFWVHHFTPIETWSARRSDMRWTLLYGANWHFIQTSQDYFAQYAGASPLLHTWSLAIEEQFYFVWPVAFLALARAVRRTAIRVAVLLCLAAASAGWMWHLSTASGTTRAYFGTDARAFELLIGAALALWTASSGPRVVVTRFATAGSVMAMIIVLVFIARLDDRATFYYRGGAAIFAAVVAALIAFVESSQPLPIGRLLSLRPIVWVGTISYGLYLWHWFVLVVTLHSSVASRLLGSTDATRWVATFAAATASYYVVERPVRRGSVPWLRTSARRLVPVAVVAVAAMFLATTTLTALPRKVAVALADYSDTSCPPSTTTSPLSWCVRQQGPPGAYTIATVGDSIVRSLDPGLVDEAARRAMTYIQSAWGGCSMSGLSIPDRQPPTKGAVDCEQWAVKTDMDMIATAHPNVLLTTELSAGVRAIDDHGTLVPAGTERHDQLLLDGYTSTFRQFLLGVPHIVLLEMNPPGLSAGCSIRGFERDPSCTRGLESDNVERYNRLLHQLASRFPGRVSVVSIRDLVCVANRCPAYVDGVLARYDGEHFTSTFARRIAPRVVDRVVAAASPR